jgi:chemotaxis protein methyltransferase CheR
MVEISQKDFLRLVEFVHSNYGIDLSKKRQLVEGRMYAPFSKSGFDDFSEYLDSLISGGTSGGLELLLNRLTTNHSYFMRERSHFDYFREAILPELERKKKNKTLSIWSAGCSTGQEPHTLSMILKDHFAQKPNWDTRVLATDISQRVLNVAKAGRYSLEDVADVPQIWLRKYFREDGEGGCVLTDEIRGNVIYRMFNLMDPIKFKMKFDVIF